MNCNLTYKELLDYLDRYNTDPMVRRLLEIIGDKEENIIEGLVDVGMDPVDGRIEGDDGWYMPGPYIQNLRNDVDYWQREAEDWEVKYQQMKDERNQLRARSIAKLLDEMEKEVIDSKDRAYAAEQKFNSVKRENEELQQKINVWKVLEA